MNQKGIAPIIIILIIAGIAAIGGGTYYLSTNKSANLGLKGGQNEKPVKTEESQEQSKGDFIVPQKSLIPEASEIGESFRVGNRGIVDESKEKPTASCPFTERADVSYVTNVIDEDKYTVLIMKCRSEEKALKYYNFRFETMEKYGAEEVSQFGDKMFHHYVCARGACEPLKISLEFKRGAYNVQILAMGSGVKTRIETIAGAVDKKLKEIIALDNLVAQGEKDAHGCVGSAGYSWCEPKSKCLITLEETCYTDTKQQIQYQLSLRYETSMDVISVKPAKVQGKYMFGRITISVPNQGLGVFLAMEENDIWKVVYHGIGGADCNTIKNVYKFPTELLSGICD
jgi:hypothetical protein